MSSHAASFEEILPHIEIIRERILLLRKRLHSFFVEKHEIIDLMILSTIAQEPLLIVGSPGTAKSNLVLTFCQSLHLSNQEYFEYMLTKFTEPGEIIGPIDLNELKQGRYLRRINGKLPEAKIAFLDEIFKSNSAILNTLLSILNERKYYQDGQPIPVPLHTLFAATNETPEFTEFAALLDRFILKVESKNVHKDFFNELIDQGLQHEAHKAFNQRPWEGFANLDDFTKLKTYFDTILLSGSKEHISKDRLRYFPHDTFVLFKRMLHTLQTEECIEVSDRKIIKLYKMIRIRAFLFHGGVVQNEDLQILRYIANHRHEFDRVRKKVDSILRLQST